MALTGWVITSGGSTTEPRLRQVEARRAGEDPASAVARIEHHPEIPSAFTAWLGRCRFWADVDQTAKPAREFYERLFQINTKTAGLGGDLKFVLGVGPLSWTLPGHPTVERDMFSAPIKITADDHTDVSTSRPVG